MSKRLRTLIDAIIGAVTTVVIALVTYFAPENATIVNGIVGAVDTLIVFILNLFTKQEQAKK